MNATAPETSGRSDSDDDDDSNSSSGCGSDEANVAVERPCVWVSCAVTYEPAERSSMRSIFFIQAIGYVQVGALDKLSCLRNPSWNHHHFVHWTFERGRWRAPLRKRDLPTPMNVRCLLIEQDIDELILSGTPDFLYTCIDGVDFFLQGRNPSVSCIKTR